MPGDGASSSTFWWRRWIEQSRSPRWTPFPCASKRTWISTWRPPSTSRSRISRSSPKAAGRLAPGGRERIGERGRVADGPHPLAAATGRRLDQQRIADPFGRGGQGGVRLVRVVVAGEHRDAERGGQPAGGGLVAHRPDRRRRRADPGQPGGGDGLGEVGVLGEEPEPGVDGVGAGGPGRRDDGLDVEQVERVGAVGRGHDRGDPEPVARPGDARRDLATIRDEEAPDRASAPSDVRRAGRLERVKRDIRDTPSPTNASRGQLPALDPALDGPRGRPKPPRDLARAQFVGHRVAIVAYRRQDRDRSGQQARRQLPDRAVMVGPRGVRRLDPGADDGRGLVRRAPRRHRSRRRRPSTPAGSATASRRSHRRRCAGSR